MFRDRTNLFLSYRRTIPRDTLPIKRTRFSDLDNEEENEGLILSSTSTTTSTTTATSNRKGRKNKSNRNSNSNNSGGSDYNDEEDIELRPMIPNIFDIAKELDSYLNIINKNIEELNSMYKKLIIINKLNKLNLEKKIEELNYQILIKFEKCYILIKKFEYLLNNYQKLKLNYNQQDLEILINFKKNYAVKIQDKSLIFRNLQNNYMKFLKNDDDDEEKNKEVENRFDTNNEQITLLNDLEESKSINTINSTNNNNNQQQQQQVQIQQQSNIQYLQQREREISKLAHGIIEILTIFKEMESMVIEQGTILDRIDYNLINTVEELNQANKELIKAHNYQKNSTKCKIIFFLSLCVFALLMIFMLRPTTSKNSHSNSMSNNNNNNNNNNNDSNISDDQELMRPNIDKPVNEVNPPSNVNKVFI